MNYLIDTNVISELRKGNRCNRHVAAWFEAVDERELYLSVLVFGEVRRGIELVRQRDPSQAAAIEKWLAALKSGYAERILPIDGPVADEWGRMSAVRPVPVIDALLAATAKVNAMTLVTRNDSDIKGLGAEILNPFLPS